MRNFVKILKKFIDHGEKLINAFGDFDDFMCKKIILKKYLFLKF